MRATTLQLRNKIATNPHKVRNILIGIYILIILSFSASARAERVSIDTEIYDLPATALR